MLSDRYTAAYEHMLVAVSQAPNVAPPELTAFWPMVGHAYDGSLMVVGRAVNGWMDHITVDALGDPAARETLCLCASDIRGERHVPDALGHRPLEPKRRRVQHGALGVLAARPVGPRGSRAGSRDDPQWSSRLVWSNLAKLAPANGGNPGGSLLDVQRQVGGALLAEELRQLAPRRVLVLTGSWWFQPFAAALGLTLEPGSGLVEGVARERDRTWVIAGHPQGKPRRILDDVISAFGTTG